MLTRRSTIYGWLFFIMKAALQKDFFNSVATQAGDGPDSNMKRPI